MGGLDLKVVGRLRIEVAVRPKAHIGAVFNDGTRCDMDVEICVGGGVHTQLQPSAPTTTWSRRMDMQELI